MALKGFSAAALSGAVCVPADPDIWAGGNVSIKANNIDGYRVRVCAPIGAMDPRWKFADCDGAIEADGPAGTAVSQTIASTIETGLLGDDGQPRFQRVADPDNAAKKCFLLNRKIGDDPANKRTELSYSPTLQPIPRAKVCWIGFGLRLPSEWKSASVGDEVMIFQVHETTDVGDDIQEAPLGMIISGGGSATPQNAFQTMWVRHNPDFVTLESGTEQETIFHETDPPTDKWQFWVVKMVSYWNNSQSPYVKAWRKVAGEGMVQVVDYTGPNTYNNTPLDFVKSGLYYYDDLWTGGVTSKTMHHKGIFLWHDYPELTAESIIEYLEEI